MGTSKRKLPPSITSWFTASRRRTIRRARLSAGFDGKPAILNISRRLPCVWFSQSHNLFRWSFSRKTFSVVSAQVMHVTDGWQWRDEAVFCRIRRVIKQTKPSETWSPLFLLPLPTAELNEKPVRQQVKRADCLRWFIGLYIGRRRCHTISHV